MTAPNFGGQPAAQGGPQGGWSPPQQGAPPQQQQAPQQQYQQPPTTVFVGDPHVQLPQPYFPTQQPVQQGQPQQQGGQQQAPQYQPAWQGGQQIPQQQPQYQPQQQQQPVPQQGQPRQQAPSQQIQVDGQGRLFGPGLPRELQGATMEQAIGYYGQMRQAYIQSQQGGQPAQQQQQPQQQQTPTQQGQIPAQSRARSIWTDPEGVIGGIVEQRLQQALAPVISQSYQQSIAQAADSVRRLYPQQFAQYEGGVMQRLQGLPPETLANPEAWRLALAAEIGEQTMRGNGGQQGGQQIPSNVNGNPQLPWQQGSQQFPAGSFFSESPSAVMQGGMNPGDQVGNQQVGAATLSPAQMEMARRFGMSPQQYAQGLGLSGVAPSPLGGNYGGR